MKVHNRFAKAKGYGVDKDSGLIHSVVTTAANVHDLTTAAELLHGDEEVVYGDAGSRDLRWRAIQQNSEWRCGRGNAGHDQTLQIESCRI